MKLRSIGICILLVAILLCLATTPMQAAFAENTPVLLLSGKTEGDEIVVTATLKNNEGISAMLLNLEYDRERLTFIGYQEGEALSSLDIVSSANNDVYPYVLTWSGDDNDASNGKLLTLRFAVKEDATGQAFVKFSYKRDRDINYYEGGELLTRNLMTDTLRIDFASGEATSIVSENSEAGNIDAEDKKNTGMIVGLAVGGAVVIVLVVLVPWLVVRKKRV